MEGFEGDLLAQNLLLMNYPENELSFLSKLIPHKILERVEEEKTSFFSNFFGHFRSYFLSG